MRKIAAWSSHDNAWHDADLVDTHVRTQILFARRAPRRRLGLKLFNFFGQKFLRKTRQTSVSHIYTRKYERQRLQRGFPTRPCRRWNTAQAVSAGVFPLQCATREQEGLGPG